MTQPIAKLPWRKGGARGGEVKPVALYQRCYFAFENSEGRKIDEGVIDSGGTVYTVRYSAIDWRRIQWWLPADELFATLPPDAKD